MTMKNNIILFTLLLTFGSCFLVLPRALALESLNFQNDLGTISANKIDAFLSDRYQTEIASYNIATADLNNDGLDEYILKQLDCTQAQAFCNYIVLAEKNNEIIELSNIKAKNILISGTYTYGIKDILAFQNTINDYDFDIYMWSSKEKMYIIKKNE